MRAHRGLIFAGLAFAVLLVIAGAVLYLRSIEFNAYRSVIVSRIESITGRDVAINGDFDVTLSFTPTLIAEEVTLANAPWGSRDAMARIERVELEIQLFPLLLGGDIRIERLVIVRPDVLLEADAEGNGNWEFNQGRAPGRAVEGPDYGEFLLEDMMIVDGTVTWRGPASDASDPLQIDRFIWQANDVTSRVSVRGVGTYRSLPIQLEGTVGPLVNLLHAGNPYPVDLRISTVNIVTTVQGQLGMDPKVTDVALEVEARGEDIAPLGVLIGTALPSFGPFEIHAQLIDKDEHLSAREIRLMAGTEASRVEATGVIRQPLEGEGLDVAVTAEGTTLAALSPLVGVALPDVGPYRVGGHLTDPGGAYQIEKVDARIGRSRIGGRILLALSADGGRTRIEGALSSERLDLEPFLEIAFVPIDERPDSDRVFSDEPFDTAFLRTADANVTLRASLVTVTGAELEDVILDVALERGRLAIEPFVFRVAGGHSEGRVLLDAGTEPLRVATRFEAKRVDIAKLLNRSIASATVSGRAGLSVDLTSVGQSPHALMDGLDGSALLVMRNGYLAGTQLDWLVTDLDLLKLLPPFWNWSSEDSVEIVCMVGQAAIDAGKVGTKILLDTERMTLVGTGVVDLGAETLDLALVPKPKSDKLSTVAVPVDIEGRFADIRVKPQTDVAVGRSVAGLLGGLFVPLNLLASLVGDEVDSACLKAIQGGGGVPVSAEADSGGSPREE